MVRLTTIMLIKSEALDIYEKNLNLVCASRGSVRFGNRPFTRLIRMSAYCFGDLRVRSGYENMCAYLQAGRISWLCLCD